MSKSLEKQLEVTRGIPENEYPRVVFFNRLKVESEHGFRLVHFGLILKSGVMASYFPCVIDDQAVEENEARLVSYLERIGHPKSKLEVWHPAAPSVDAGFTDSIGMASRGEVAEISLCIYSVSAALHKRSGDGKVSLKAQPVALLRSNLELHRHFIKALYGR